VDRGESLQSERRVVTVLFADMVGFTGTVEKIDPEVVTDALNEVFTALGAEVEAVGGHVDKIVGDEVMALFGAPVAHEDDALRAVRAARAMHAAMAQRTGMLRRMLGQALRLRIGIHSGQVVWGVVGPPGSARPTVMGDVVNVASRLQRAAPEGSVLVSEAVARQIRGVYLCRAWEPLVVKGRVEPVAVYEVVGEREQAEPMFRPPFVDREADLRQFEEFLARARRGRAYVVVVSGDPGVGKTRLVEEFSARLPGDVQVLKTSCPPYGGQSLGPLAELFRQLIGLAGPTTVADVQARVPLSERAARAAAVVSRLFNLAEVPPGEEVSHETALLIAAETVRRLITRPAVVWIEDLQWADAGTRELLTFMMDRLADAPLLLIGNLRAGEEPLPWGKRTAVTTMQLGALERDDARALLAAIVEDELPADVEEVLLAKAGGNPFYLSEIVATLRSTGVLVRADGGRARLTGSVERVLPDTIQAALLARLDRLAPEQRTLVQRAAVVGVSFPQSLLVEICPGIDVPHLLGQLEEAYLIQGRDALAADPEYVFVHPLMREVAYGSLLSKHQGVLHRQVAEGLERLYPERSEQLAKEIGTHFDRGGVPEKAAAYLLQAGRQAAGRYATREAIGLLERVRAIAAQTQPGPAGKAAEILAELYRRVEGYGPKVWFEMWASVLAAVDPAEEPERFARAAIGAAFARAADNELAAARELLTRAELHIPAGHPLWSRLYAVRALTLILGLDYRQALEAALAAVDVANRVGTLHDRAQAYEVLAHPAVIPLLGNRGREMMREWTGEARARGDERILIDASFAFTSDVWTRGIVDDTVLELLEQVTQKADEHGWTHDEARLRVLQGWAKFLLGRWDEAEAHLRRARQEFEARGGRFHALGWLILLPYAEANLAMARGHLTAARALFADALTKLRFHAPIWLNHDLARCHQMLGDEAAAGAAMARSLEARDRFRCIVCGCQANGVAAEFYAVLGDTPQAEALIQEAETAATEIGHIATRVRARRARARLLLARGQESGAVDAAQQALALSGGFPLRQPFEEAQTLLLLGMMQQAAGDGARAVESWQRARQIFADLGAIWHLRRAEEALASTEAPRSR